MNDRELIELAAKASGVNGFYRVWHSGNEPMVTSTGIQLEDGFSLWNPLTNDGDALRLAVKLRLQIQVNDASIEVDFPQDDVGITRESVYQYPDSKLDDEDNIVHINHEAATRRAIVRAAAEIGRGIAQKVGSDVPKDNYYKTQAEAEEIGRAAAAAEIGRLDND